MRPAAAVVLAVLLAVAAGCGGGNDEEAAALLERGFATDVETGLMALDAEVELEGVAQVDEPLRLRLDGPFRAAGGPTELPDLDMTFRAEGAGQELSGRVILTRENAWVEYQGTTYEVGEELWAQALETVETPQPGAPESFAEAGIDPIDWIDDAETDGEEEVGGTPTTKVSARLDLEAMLRDFNDLVTDPESRIPESAFDQLDDVVEDVDFEAWVGEDDIWRRISAESDFEVPEDDRDGAGGLESGRVELDMQLAEPNAPVEIEGPAAARPIDELLGRLGIPPELLLGPGFAQPAPG